MKSPYRTILLQHQKITIQLCINAIYQNDMYLLSSALMRIALRKRDFIDLCKCAIKMRYRHILTFLFDAYYQFWKQEIFDELIRYTTLANAYEMYGVLDECIDKINSIFDRAESS